MADTFPNGLVIYKWKVPAGTAYIRFANSSTVDDVYLITKNQPFNCETFYTHWTVMNVDYSPYVNIGYNKVTAAKDIKNLFDASKCKSGAYNESGTLLAGDYYTTDLISVTKGDVLYFGKTPLMDGFQLKTFDSAKKPIQGKIQSPACKTVDYCSDSSVILSYEIPEGVSYVAVSCKGTYKNSYVLTKNQPFNESVLNQVVNGSSSGSTGNDELDTLYPINQDSPLKGITVGFYGDSISAAGVDNNTKFQPVKGWAGRIGRTNAMEWYNHSVSAYSVSNCRGAKTIISQLQSTIKRDYDMIILHGGTNDAWDNAPVGKMTEGFGASNTYDVTTFAGGLEQIFAYIREQNPDAMVGYVINFKFINASKGATVSIPNGDKKPTMGYRLNNMEDYVEMTKKICDKWGVPYVDLYSIDELTTALHPESKGTYSNVYLSDFIHPTSAGYDIIYPYIEEFMIDMVTPDVEPEPDPTVTEPVETPVETPVTDKTNDKKEGGCKSFTVSFGATVAVICLAGATLFTKKRKI